MQQQQKLLLCSVVSVNKIQVGEGHAKKIHNPTFPPNKKGGRLCKNTQTPICISYTTRDTIFEK